MAQPLSDYVEMIGNAFGGAFERTVQMLFRGFDWRRWGLFGVGAWLAALGRGGGGGNFNFPSGNTGEVGQWLREHMVLVVTVAVAVVLIGLALRVLVLWLSSRGKFVFIENIATDRPGIREPWRRHARIGNSLFLWRLALNVAVVLVVLIAVGGGIGAVAALRQYKPLIVFGVVLGVLFVLFLALVVGVITTLLEDFVVPLMYRYEMGASEAWRYFVDLLGLHLKGFAFYLLARLALGLATGAAGLVIVVAVSLLTCCVGGIVLMIPFVGSLAAAQLLLPLHVFSRCFSICFLQQFHSDYRLITVS